jgi:Tol biopolymer transport system component
MRTLPHFAVPSVLLALLPWLASAEVQRFELISGTTEYGYAAASSSDGRFVAYQSGNEIYVRDRVRGTTVKASVPDTGTVDDSRSGGASISDDGRYVAFRSDVNLATGVGFSAGSVWVRDLALGRTEEVTVGVLAEYPDAWEAVISRDGRFVVFVSAKPFVANDVNGDRDVYLRDRSRGTTELVSLDMTGQPAGYSEGSLSMSSDGRYVAFTSYSHELVNQPTANGGVYVRDLLLGTTELVSVNWAGKSVGAYGGTISGNGRYVAFLSPFWNMVQGDTNRAIDVFIRDRVERTTTRVSVTSAGLQANGNSGGPSLSADGRFVGFVSRASNLVPVAGMDGLFVRDRVTGRTEFIISGDPRKGPAGGGITADGRTVILQTARALLAEDRDLTSDIYAAELTVPSTTYNFTLKPLSIDFGELPLGSTATRTFLLRNKGAAALPLLRVFMRGGSAETFTVAHTCGAAIAPGAVCSISATFNPTVIGVSSTKLVVVAGDRQVRERPIVGTGVQP